MQRTEQLENLKNKLGTSKVPLRPAVMPPLLSMRQPGDCWIWCRVGLRAASQAAIWGRGQAFSSNRNAQWLGAAAKHSMAEYDHSALSRAGRWLLQPACRSMHSMPRPQHAQHAQQGWKMAAGMGLTERMSGRKAMWASTSRSATQGALQGGRAGQNAIGVRHRVEAGRPKAGRTGMWNPRMQAFAAWHSKLAAVQRVPGRQPAASSPHR